MDSITYYNRFNSLEDSARKVSEKYGLPLNFQNISNWLKDFAEYLPFLKMREFIAKKYKPQDILAETRLFHFKCAWFDEEDYFEFYPLHVVYKKKTKKRKLKITKADIGLLGN